MPLLVTGHEDKYIRIFDLLSGMYLIIYNLDMSSQPVFRAMHTLDPRAPGRSHLCFARRGGFLSRLRQPRLLRPLLGHPWYACVRAGNYQPPRKGPRGRAGGRVPPESAGDGQRRGGRCRETLCLVVIAIILSHYRFRTLFVSSPSENRASPFVVPSLLMIDCIFSGRICVLKYEHACNSPDIPLYDTL